MIDLTALEQGIRAIPVESKDSGVTDVQVVPTDDSGSSDLPRRGR